MVNEKVAPAEELNHERALPKAIPHRMNSMFYKTRIGKVWRSVHAHLLRLPVQQNQSCFHYMNTVCEHHAEVVDNPEQQLPWNDQQTVPAISGVDSPPDYLVPNVVSQRRQALR
ncbi:MAG: hypothetical protein ACOX52_13620 [Verrucomicrobiota bacterium]|jgi:transposase